MAVFPTPASPSRAYFVVIAWKALPASLLLATAIHPPLSGRFRWRLPGSSLEWLLRLVLGRSTSRCRSSKSGCRLFISFALDKGTSADGVLQEREGWMEKLMRVIAIPPPPKPRPDPDLVRGV